MNKTRNPLTLAIALGAVLAMPVAFAQQPPTDTTGAPPTAQPQDPTTTTDDSAAPATTPGEPTAQPQQLTWADVDADGNGSISKSESAALPSLAQVFDQADADADGELTTDEYQAFVAANAGGQADDGSGGSD